MKYFCLILILLISGIRSHSSLVDAQVAARQFAEITNLGGRPSSSSFAGGLMTMGHDGKLFRNLMSFLEETK